MIVEADKHGEGQEESQVKAPCDFGLSDLHGDHSTTVRSPKLHKKWNSSFHRNVHESVWFVVHEPQTIMNHYFFRFLPSFTQVSEIMMKMFAISPKQKGGISQQGST